MDQRTESRVEEWESRPFSGGYRDLHDLAENDFSGAVVSRSGTWLLMLNGRAVGVFEGRIEDFEDAEGVVYQAPHPSLPLLFTMLEKRGDQQAKYYTNDTPISEAHQQLSDASFTGYLELSENVLSGDYYVLYYGGRSMSCAFVGSSDRLLTGDEAFGQADDEVGIYEVRSVDIDVVEIPEPTGGATGGAGGQSAGGAGGEPSADEPLDVPPAAGGDQGATDQSADATESPPGGQDSPADPAAAGGDRPAGQPAGSGTPEPPAGDQPVADDPAVDDPAANESEVQPTDPVGEPAAEDAGGAGGQPATGTADTGGGTGGQPATGTADTAGGTGGQPATGEGPGQAPTDPATGQADAGAAEPTDPAANQADAASGGTAQQTDADPVSEPTGGSPPADAGRQSGASGSAGATGGSSGGSTATAQAAPRPPSEFDDVKTVPSLDPDRTLPPGADAGSAGDGAGTADQPDSAATGGSASAGAGAADTDAGTADAGAGTDAGSTRGGPAGTGAAGAAGQGGSADEPRRTPEEATGGAVRSSGQESSPADAAVDAVADDAESGELRAELAAREQRIQELETQLGDLRVQRDGLRDERDQLREEVERLQAEIDELEGEAAKLRERLGDDGENKRRMSAEQALAGTNLFVRYGSKSGGTLEKAHEGEMAKAEVNENLRLENHTQFDADEVVVDDQPFAEFLDGTIYKQYVDWVVRELLYEIRGTGSVKKLKDLYDALPQIDRAELLGEVTVEYTEDGEQYREQRQFDVVLRDRMGHPLLVADINDARNPASEGMMSSVIENATDVKGSNDMLASAMLVTASFFEPGALEAADDAAGGGGLMGGTSKASYVKLSRKKGYHLLLVESRAGEFHVNVPEL